MRIFSESVAPAPAPAINAAAACFHGLHEKIVQLFSESVASAAAVNAAVALIFFIVYLNSFVSPLLYARRIRKKKNSWNKKNCLEEFVISSQI